MMLGFPGAFSGDKVKLVGNPIRENIIALHNRKRDFAHEDLNIAVVGGSLGAQALNELVPQALKQCKNCHIKVTHQCGKNNEESVKAAYAQAGFKYTVNEFISDMQSLYAQNDLIICRAGALTVAETAASGIPAIFVPLPSAVDDHQTKNAKFMEKCQAALVCPQHSLNAEKLSEIIDGLNNDRQKLAFMSANAYANAVLDAASKACDIIIKASK